MINKISLKSFKCFESVIIPITELTLLSGANASGKSSFLQSLILLHQSIRENEWANRLMLNGEILQLGTVSDVVDKIHGRRDFQLDIEDHEHRYSWLFSGERAEMSMAIDRIQIDLDIFQKPDELCKLIPLNNPAQDSYLPRVLGSINYITAERLGPREFYKLDDPWKGNTVGPFGEHAVSVLHTLRDMEVQDDLVLEGNAPTLLRQVEARMQQFFPGCGLIVEPIARMNAVTLGLRTSDATDYHRPINVGFGLTQILPIVVATLSAKPGDLILIENPEVHLHPAGQALMGTYLSEVSSVGVQVIVETHSDHVLNGIRRGVKSSILTPEQVSLHFFRSETEELDKVASPRVDSNGNIDYWPEGFFDQFDKDMNYFAGWDE